MAPRTGDIFDSSAQTLVNPVNCVGVMGKGLALEFGHRFPAMYRNYQARCAKGIVRPGRPYIFKTPGRPNVINFPTKAHWRGKGCFNSICEGLVYMHAMYKAWGVTSLAVPALGTGTGGLDWGEIESVLTRHFDMYDIPVELYAPMAARETGPHYQQKVNMNCVL